MSTKFKVGDRVVYSGEVINESWDADTQGTVVGVRTIQLIDIRWDHGVSNNGHFSSDFLKVSSNG